MREIKNVGLIINYHKKQPIILAKEIIKWLTERNIKVYIPEEEALNLNLPIHISDEKICENIDCMLVLGGDGTLLRSARFLAGYDVPILGVNLGRLGFLTEIEVGEVYVYLEELIKGRYSIEERSMLFARVMRDEKCIGESFALNDLVINKGSFARLITLEVFLEKEYISSYSADGIIISTPTGSTAYSLSAGGPLVYPQLDVNIITPICPHSFYSRPIVIPSNQTVKVHVRAVKADAKLTVDGQCGFQLEDKDQIWINKSDYVTKLIKIKGRSFFEILSQKLKVDGGSNYD